MAYSKLVTCGLNYAVGIQTVNQARDNLDANYTAWSARHGVEERISYGTPTRPAPRIQEMGHHDNERIPRDCVLVTPRTSGGFVVVDMTPGRALGQVIRTSPGKFIFQVTGLSEFWGHVVPQMFSTSTVYTWSCKSIYPSSSAPYLQVELFFGSGAYDPADNTFSLTLYGNP